MVAMATALSCRVSATAFCQLTTQALSISNRLVVVWHTKPVIAILVPKLVAMATSLRPSISAVSLSDILTWITHPQSQTVSRQLSYTAEVTSIQRFTCPTPCPKGTTDLCRGWWDPHCVQYGSSRQPQIDIIALDFSICLVLRNGVAESVDFGSANRRKLEFFATQFLGGTYEHPQKMIRRPRYVEIGRKKKHEKNITNPFCDLRTQSRHFQRHHSTIRGSFSTVCLKNLSLSQHLESISLVFKKAWAVIRPHILVDHFVQSGNTINTCAPDLSRAL